MTRQDDTQLSRSGRKRRTGRESGREMQETAAAEGTELPPRRVKFPSNKYQTARWFYNTLIVLFLALMAALFWFGRQMSGG